MKTVGILGGTFNPIHYAHLAMAQAAWGQTALDEIWFMPSKHPPHKSNCELVSELHRKKMIELAIAKEPCFHFSDYELKWEGTTYSAETLQRLKEDYPEYQFYFIMGGDSFFQLENWYHPEIIMKCCRILAISRDGASLQQMEIHAEYLHQIYRAEIQIVKMDTMEISSSQIRQNIREGRNISSLVPEEVASYIRQHQLYQ